MQPDAITETLQRIALEIAGVSPPTELDDQGRPLWLFEQTAHETCDRAGLAEGGRFAKTLADHGTCLAKVGCAGPVAKCNVPARGWVNGVGGCPNVGGICIACTMPGFPDHFLPFMDSGPYMRLTTGGSRFLYGPVLRRMREPHDPQARAHRHQRVASTATLGDILSVGRVTLSLLSACRPGHGPPAFARGVALAYAQRGFRVH